MRKMKRDKKGFFGVFIILQVLFVLCLAGIIVQRISPVWARTSDFSVGVLPQDGSKEAIVIPVDTYSPFLWEYLPTHVFQAQSCEGENRIRAAYFARKFESINADYVETTQTVLEPQYTVLHRSANSFCYQISGAPNGAVWEVWSCNVTSGTPYVCLHILEGGAAE